MGHLMPTNDSDMPQKCWVGAPYISDCGYPAAENILRHTTGILSSAARIIAREENLYTFNQNKIVGNKSFMSTYGHVYIPEKCKNGESCAIHVSFHGCMQTDSKINRGVVGFDGNLQQRIYQFSRDAGYNAEAERLGVIVLYPQAFDDETGNWMLFNPLPRNPRACWDFWGYSGEHYLYKDGAQISAVWKMIEALKGNR